MHLVKDVDPPTPMSPYSAHSFPSGPTSPTSPTSTSHSHSHSHAAPHPNRSRIPITIVGNKRDQVALREVSTDEGRDTAHKLGCDFFEASAKTNMNVEASFKSLVRQIKAQRRIAEGGTAGPEGAGGPAGMMGGGGAGLGGRGAGKKRKKCVIL